jgi:hypothetical protein
MFVAISVAQQEDSSQEPIYKCYIPGLRLTGRLVERIFYGPPGFGETPSQDAKERVMVRELSKPIRIAPLDDAALRNAVSRGTFHHVRRVQLFFIIHHTGNEANKLLGKRVTVVGTLREAVAPSEHLTADMEVATLIAN